MDSIVAVMAEIEITASVSGDPHAARKHRVDQERGLEVEAWTGDRLESHFMVGRSTREETYVRGVDDTRILTVRGRCLRLFDRTLDELRHPVITDIAVTEIEEVRYSNAYGRLDLVADPEERGRFVPKGTTIRNFDRDRASQNVGVIAHLLAKRFVDAPGDRDGTGLFDDETPQVTLLVRGADGSRSVDVWVGTRTRDRLLHIRSSEGEQIYLVSAHLETSLVPRRSHFERSDEMMRQLKAQRDEATRSEGEHGTTTAPAHTHGRSQAPLSQVPPELMKALRALAREQREQP